jgi:hypothetical protein
MMDFLKSKFLGLWIFLISTFMLTLTGFVDKNISIIHSTEFMYFWGFASIFGAALTFYRLAR